MIKYAIYSFALTTLLVLQSCGDPAEQVNKTTRQERIPVVLSDADLFNGNKVLAFLDNDKKFIQDANELFLKGLDSYRNKKELDSANIYFRQSILKEPSAKAYFELGNVFMDEKKYDKAISAYGVAEQLDYEPFSKILYNKACIYSLQDNPEMSSQYLEYALQAGYTNIEHIAKDSDLKRLRETHRYQRAIDKGLRGVSNSENLFWLQFKKLFAVTDIPLKLEPVMNAEMQEALVYISYDYEKYISEMRDEKFSREVSKGFFYFAQPYENENFVAVVYIVKDEFMGEYAPLTYVLATYTHDGKLIDKEIIGGRSSLSEPIMVATLERDKNITIKMQDPEYDKDPDEYGYYENDVKKYTEVGSKKLHITEEGKIVTDSEKLS